MRFKVDQNLPREAADLLGAAGHDATTVADEGLTGASDEAIAERSRKERRGILTLDVHFADIRTYPPGAYDGIIVIRTRFPDKPRLLAIVRRLLPLLSPRELAGRLWIVEGNRIRMRRGMAT